MTTDFEIYTLSQIVKEQIYRDEFGEVFVWKRGARWYREKPAEDGRVILYVKGPRTLHNCVKLDLKQLLKG